MELQANGGLTLFIHTLLCWMGMRLYSTNRGLPGGFKKTASFEEALLMGQAPDGGLFMPARLPRFDLSRVHTLKGRPFYETAQYVFSTFLNGGSDDEALRRITKEVYTFDIPLEKARGNTWLMRLDQGPTASFKDFAALMLAKWMDAAMKPGERLTILVATSGDTGSAVGEAFKSIPGIRVIILYPENEVSPNQKKQLDTIGGNVQALAVDAKFDDCQNMVKQAFSDPDLAHLGLTSANSINFGRILPQMTYYVHAYAQLAAPGEHVVFSVPSGNFGDALGCEFTRRMGLPVERIVLAVNANDEFPRFLETGLYEKVSPSRECLSNAMNVGHPSNLARFFDLYGGTVDKAGIVHKQPDVAAMRSSLFSVSVTDNETRETIQKVYNEHHALLEPHGAVGWRGLEAFRKETGWNGKSVILETAHPAKFPEAIQELLGFTPEAPAALKGLAQRSGEPVRRSADYETIKHYLCHSNSSVSRSVPSESS